MAAAGARLLDQLDAGAVSQAVVDQADLVVAGDHRLETGIGVGHPAQRAGLEARVDEKVPQDDVIVLVVLHEEDAQARMVHGGAQEARNPGAGGSSTTSSQ